MLPNSTFKSWVSSRPATSTGNSITASQQPSPAGVSAAVRPTICSRISRCGIAASGNSTVCSKQMPRALAAASASVVATIR